VGGSGALFNFTLADILNASVAARAYLEGTDTFLVEEATEVEKGGDAAMAQLWKMAGGGLRMMLQVRTVRTVRTSADALERRADVRVLLCDDNDDDNNNNSNNNNGNSSNTDVFTLDPLRSPNPCFYSTP